MKTTVKAWMVLQNGKLLTRRRRLAVVFSSKAHTTLNEDETWVRVEIRELKPKRRKNAV